MKTFAYLRISTGSQDLDNQKLAILDYARRKDFKVDEFIERKVSSRKTVEERGLTTLLNRLEPNDRLIVSELSRIGRSLGQIIQTIDELVKKNVHFVAIKESIEFNGKRDIQTKVMVAMIGLFAEIERDLVSCLYGNPFGSAIEERGLPDGARSLRCLRLIVAGDAGF